MTLSTAGNPFAGREREMAELTSALDSALQGSGRMVMVVGSLRCEPIAPPRSQK